LIDLFDLVILGGVAFLASLLGSVAGSGGTAVLLPVLVLYYGIKDSIPILTIANLASNLGRVWFNRKEIDGSVVGCFALGAIPLALGGAVIFVIMPPGIVTRILGIFLLVILAWRRIHPNPPRINSVAWFVPLGAGFGLLAGVLEGVGPLMAPFFLAYGLLRGAYIGTDALVTVLMQVPKLGVFGVMDIIDRQILISGLFLIPFMIAGAFAGKMIVDRISETFFVLVIDMTLIVAGVSFLVRGQ
jgi:uncharacterized protein